MAKSHLRTGLALVCVAFFITCTRAQTDDTLVSADEVDPTLLFETDVSIGSYSYGYYPSPSYYSPPSYGSYGTYDYAGYGDYSYQGYYPDSTPVVYYSPVSQPSSYYGGYAEPSAVYYVEYGTPTGVPRYGYYSPASYSSYSAPTSSYYGYYTPSSYGYYSYATPESYGYGYYSTPSYGYYGSYTYSSYGYTDSGSYFGSYSQGAYASCPTCPVCNAASHASVTTHESGRRHAGQCYCSYDHDWKTWAVADTACRSALFERCDKDSRLPCSWLDNYFSFSASGTFTRPHEKDIYNYLYSDCPPAEPCACSSLNFDGRDGAGDVYTCCRELEVYAQVPFSGMAPTTVDAFCSRGAHSQLVKSWVQHALWHASCPANTVSNLYTLVSDEQLSRMAASSQLPANATGSSYAGSASSSTLAAGSQQVVSVSRSAVFTMSLVAGAAGLVAGATIAAVVIVLLTRRQAGEYILMA